MNEEERYVVSGILMTGTVTRTQFSMLIEQKVNTFAVFGVMVLIAGILFWVFSSAESNGSSRLILPGLVMSGFIIFQLAVTRSYRYEIDKKMRVIKCQTGEFAGLLRDEIAYPMHILSHVQVEQITNRWRDEFRVKLILQTRNSLDLPSEHSLAGCMKYAEMYSDFLELKIPIELPR